MVSCVEQIMFLSFSRWLLPIDQYIFLFFLSECSGEFRPFVTLMQFCLEVLVKSHLLVGYLLVCPEDFLLFQWHTMAKGKFQRKAWNLLFFGVAYFVNQE